jgi:DNA-binding transcriptional ArsR family regulator
VLADADISEPAALLGDPVRAQIVLALADGSARPATELCARARRSAPTVSAHLAKLVDGGLVAFERQGRHRYYRLADPAVAHAVEALAVIAPRRPARSLRESAVGAALREGRTCYDHLAGRLGIAVTDALLASGALERSGGRFVVADTGAFESLGVNVEELRTERRELVRACLDWTERREHVAGAVGAAIARAAFDYGWIERIGRGRAVRVTDRGRRALARRLRLVF